MDIAGELQYVINQVKKVRIRQGISQMELSLRSNLSQSFLANLENGKKQPSVLTLIRIASALGVSARDFFPPPAASRRGIKQEIIKLLECLPDPPIN
jgi:transcriptional regulator with XRE-family HTH domain